MTEIRRNDPCPCDSGKKFKKCCSPVLQERDRLIQSAQQPAMDWLVRHRRAAVDAALWGSYLSLVEQERMDRLEEEYEELHGVILSNALEWVVLEGLLPVEDPESRSDELLGPLADNDGWSALEEIGPEQPVEGMEWAPALVLGPGGPELGAAERDWIAQAARRPLGLYRLEETAPGAGFRVTPLLKSVTGNGASEDGGSDLWVSDREFPHQVGADDVVGLRLMRLRERWVNTAAAYLFPEMDEGQLVEGVERSREDLAMGEEDPWWLRRATGEAVRDAWLESLFFGRPEPEVRVHTTTEEGEPMVLVQDVYGVTAWKRLRQALEARDDVAPSPTLHGGMGWARIEGEGDSQRPRGFLQQHEERPNLLVLVSTTRRQGDENREWLEELAGEVLEHREREVQDGEG